MRNWVRIRVPPSINSVRIPSCERSCRIVSGVIGSVLATITVATRRNAAKCSGDASVPAITIFRPVPSEKNRACGSSRPLALTVTLTGSAGLPCAVRFSRSFSLRVTNAGLSLRMVSAPTSTASHSARKARTCSQSFVPESTRRREVVSSIYPSSETAAEAHTIIAGKVDLLYKTKII